MPDLETNRNIMTTPTENLFDKLQSLIEIVPKFTKEQSIVVVNTKTNKYFAGFKTDAKPKWSKDLFKAQMFPYPNEFNVELKMNLRCLINVGVAKEDLETRIFEYNVGTENFDIGPIAREVAKRNNNKVDLDQV